MEQTIAYVTLAVTSGLAVSRPRIGIRDVRITPGFAALMGVGALLGAGILQVTDLLVSFQLQWRALVCLTCIMVMTGVVKEVGAFERLALRLEAYARGKNAIRAFNAIFMASVLIPSLLNNDAAILLLTPIVVALARRLFPGNRRVLEAFVFAVFLAPGVAPFTVSNPMNMVVAEVAGIGFNAYAAVMAPIAVVGAALTYIALRLHYGRALVACAAPEEAIVLPKAHPAERPALGFLLAVFLAYPVMAIVDGPLWAVAVVGAVGSTILVRLYRIATPLTLARHVSLDVLTFLWGVFLVVAGLRNVGIVDRLSRLYEGFAATDAGHLGLIGLVSAVGSAVIDNHPMALLNLMALENHIGHRPLLAALIGGDLGPRLLPVGSLAGLLWLELLRRNGVRIGLRKFVRVGTLTLVPSLAASLLLHWAM